MTRRRQVVHPDVVVTGDIRVALVAQAQHGVISWAQLLAAGLGRGAIRHRVARGRQHRVHRGVYRVGHPLALPLGREMAAVLACGRRAVISHRSAAGLGSCSPTTASATVTSRRSGVMSEGTWASALTAPSRLGAGDVRSREGIPLTGLARTLLDLAAVAKPRELQRAFDEAVVRRLLGPGQLRDVIVRTPNARGVPILRALLDDEQAPMITRSEAEECLLALIGSAKLKLPQVNARVHGFEVDMLWPAERLVVEMDGYAFHSSPTAFERDRARDAARQARGYGVLRFTWRQVTSEAPAVAAVLGAALARADCAAHGG